jgi:hypothetical protein
MPRVLLLIDEFQELFVEDDRISQGAALLLDRIVRQGRAFGIHVLLGSQTLGGAYTLARATIGQMVVRVALQCNEADAYLIMNEDNPAPRLLSRPGEAIYNDEAARSETVRSRSCGSGQVRENGWEGARSAEVPAEFKRAAPYSGSSASIVFERARACATILAPRVARRESIQPGRRRVTQTRRTRSKEAASHRASGNHLLIIPARRRRWAWCNALMALAAQHARRVFVFDCSAPDSRSEIPGARRGD